MTEQVQLAIVAGVTQVALGAIGFGVTWWRSELARKEAREARIEATTVKGIVAVVREEQTAGIVETKAAVEEVHQALNGGAAVAKAELQEVKEQVVDLKIALAVAKVSPAEPVPGPDERLGEIRGEQR